MTTAKDIGLYTIEVVLTDESVYPNLSNVYVLTIEILSNLNAQRGEESLATYKSIDSLTM